MVRVRTRGEAAVSSFVTIGLTVVAVAIKLLPPSGVGVVAIRRVPPTPWADDGAVIPPIVGLKKITIKS